MRAPTRLALLVAAGLFLPGGLTALTFAVLAEKAERAERAGLARLYSLVSLGCAFVSIAVGGAGWGAVIWIELQGGVPWPPTP